MTTPGFLKDEAPILNAINWILGQTSQAGSVCTARIMAAEGCPRQGITSYATVGLSALSIGMLPGGIPLGVELVAAAADDYPRYLEALSGCINDVCDHTFQLHPGAVYKNAIQAEYPDLTMKHFLFDTPRGWDREFLTLELPDRVVSWLMAVPLSDSELAFYHASDSGDLQDKMDRAQVEIYDLNRAPVV